MKTPITALTVASMFICVATAEKKPNILFILADDMGYGDLACYGNALAKTPNIDRLAAEGVRCTDFYAPSAVCSPSRAGLLTGRNPHRAGVYNHLKPGAPGKGAPGHLRAQEITIAEWLRDKAGYQTVHVGKWHLGDLEDPAKPAPWEQGFEKSYAFIHGKPTSKDDFEFAVYRNGRPATPARGSTAQLVGELFAEWADTVDKERPFFAYLAPQEPHVPLNLRPKFLAMHKDAGEQQNYQADVTELDGLIGCVRTILKVRGLDKNTLIIFSSDNGAIIRAPLGYTGTNGPLRGQKGQFHDGGIRVPGIFCWPGVLPSGTTCSEPLTGLDLFPSFCALAGIEPPVIPLDGENILASLTGGKPRQRPIFWIRDWKEEGPSVALRDGDFKITAMIENRLLTGFQIYDLRRDIGETGTPAAGIGPERQRDLENRLRAAFDSVAADTVIWPAKGHAASPAWMEQLP